MNKDIVVYEDINKHSNIVVKLAVRPMLEEDLFLVIKSTVNSSKTVYEGNRFSIAYREYLKKVNEE